MDATTTTMMPAVHADRRDLERYVIDGDQSAFAAIVERHRALVYAVCRRRLSGNSHLADDATQVVFLALASKAGALVRRREVDMPLADWLLVAARYAVADLRRAEFRRRRREREAAMQTQDDHPADHLVDDELRSEVVAAVDRLPAALRRAVVLRYLADQPHDAVAAELGISPTTLSKRLQRGLGRLRSLLGRRHPRLTTAAIAAACTLTAGEIAGATATPVILGTVAAPGTAVVLSAKGILSAMSYPTIVSLGAAGVTVAAIVCAVAITLAGGEVAPTGGFDEAGVVVRNLLTGNASPSPADVVATDDGCCLIAGTLRVGGQADYLVLKLRPDGSPDPTFGEEGRVRIDVAGLSDEACQVRQLADGGVVVLGTTFTSLQDRAFGVVKLTAAGQRDAAFGKDGVQLISFGDYTIAHALAVQADGCIVVGGRGGKDAAFARLLPDGKLDPAFGHGGKMLHDFGSTIIDVAHCIVIDENRGAIIASGAIAEKKNFEGVLARFALADGSPDPACGSKGVVRFVVSDHLVGTTSGCGVGPDGSMYWSGFSYDSASMKGAMCLVRRKADGSADETFTTTGINRFPLTEQGERLDANAQGVVVQADGKPIVFGFHLHDQTLSAALVRFLPDGRPDPGFGKDGCLVLKGFRPGKVSPALFGEGAAQRLCWVGFVGDEAMALRLDGRGRPDPDFGKGGQVSIATTVAADETAVDLAIDGEGRCVAAADARLDRQQRGLVCRFLADGSPDAGFGVDGIAELRPGPEGYALPAQLAVDGAGRTVVVGRASMSSSPTEQSEGMFIARLGVDGKPDAIFGRKGIFFSDLRGPDGRSLKDVLTCVAIDGEGGICAAGYQPDPDDPNQTDLVLVRLDGQGRPRRGFGEDGIRAAPLGLGKETPRAIQSLPDGAMLVAGSASDRHYADALLVRFAPDGTLDPGFGDLGRVLVNHSTSKRGDEATALATGPDGMIYVAGTSDEESYRGRGFISRFTALGSLDASFGREGTVYLDHSAKGQEFITDLLVEDGRVIAVGYVEERGEHLVASGFCWILDHTGRPAAGKDGVRRLSDRRCARPTGLVRGADGALRILATGTGPAVGDLVLLRLADE